MQLTVDGHTPVGTLAYYNPLRYRGYVYDQETGLYYLQSRYYNPEWGRFINADGLTSTGQGMLGNNMFAYCGNNPVSRNDPMGNFWCPLIDWIIIKFNEKNNKKADFDKKTSTENKLISSQKEVGKYFDMGIFSVEYNACEPIALHDAMILIGKPSKLSDRITECQYAGGAFAFGSLGTNPHAAGWILSYHNIDYTKFDSVSDMTQPGVYIVSYWNGTPFLSSLHTIAVVYDGESRFVAYNYKGGFGKIDMAAYASSFITGYYLGPVGGKQGG